MSDNLGKINKVAASNLFSRHGQTSYYACACCLQAFGRGDGAVFGKVGCVGLPFDNAEVRACFAPYKVELDDGSDSVQVFKCLRCMFVGRDCFAVSCPVWSNLASC